MQEGHLLPLSHSRLGLRRIRVTHSWSDAFPVTPVTHTPAEDGLRKWSRQCRQACPAERPTQTRTRRTQRTARDATKAVSCIFHSHACICFPRPLRKARHVWKASLLGDPASVLRVESGSIHMHGCMSKAPAARPLPLTLAFGPACMSGPAWTGNQGGLHCHAHRSHHDENARSACAPAQELPHPERCDSHKRTQMRTDSAQYARHARQGRTRVAGASWCSASARIDAVTPEPQEHTSGCAGSTPAAVNSARSSAGGRSRPPATTCALSALIAHPCTSVAGDAVTPHRWPDELAGDPRTCTAHQCTDGSYERAKGECTSPLCLARRTHAAGRRTPDPHSPQHSL